jgi:hypothetical protein
MENFIMNEEDNIRYTINEQTLRIDSVKIENAYSKIIEVKGFVALTKERFILEDSYIQPTADQSHEDYAEYEPERIETTWPMSYLLHWQYEECEVSFKAVRLEFE